MSGAISGVRPTLRTRISLRSCGLRVTGASKLLSNALRHFGLGEGRHPDMTSERSAQHQYCDGRAGAFAQSHPEIEQGWQPELIEQLAMPRFGRDMTGARGRETVWSWE